jgi:hypothetical protein
MTLDELLSKGGSCEPLGTSGDWSSFRFELNAPRGMTFANGKTFMLAVSMGGVKERLLGTKLQPMFGNFKKVGA